jgi:hypothetical protein
MTETHELVVPKSIPIIFPILLCYLLSNIKLSFAFFNLYATGKFTDRID